MHSTFFTSLTIFDPILHPFAFEKECQRACVMYVTLGYTRRDVWSSKRAALRDLKNHRMFGTWDPRQLALYVVSYTGSIGLAKDPWGSWNKCNATR